MISVKQLTRCRGIATSGRDVTTGGFGATIWQRARRALSTSQPSRSRVIIDQALGHSISIFAEDAFPLDAVNAARSLVIACLNASEGVFAVHHVRFAINDGATIKPRREQITRIDITARPDLGGNVCRRILVG